MKTELTHISKLIAGDKILVDNYTIIVTHNEQIPERVPLKEYLPPIFNNRPYFIKGNIQNSVEFKWYYKEYPSSNCYGSKQLEEYQKALPKYLKIID